MAGRAREQRLKTARGELRRSTTMSELASLEQLLQHLPNQHTASGRWFESISTHSTLVHIVHIVAPVI